MSHSAVRPASDAEEKYETFRYLGFGTTSGKPLPAEATGTCASRRRGRGKLRFDPSGYEISVTAASLVACLSAIANGGELPEPHLVKEIRAAEGELLYRAEPRPCDE